MDLSFLSAKRLAALDARPDDGEGPQYGTIGPAAAFPQTSERHRLPVVAGDGIGLLTAFGGLPLLVRVGGHYPLHPRAPGVYDRNQPDDPLALVELQNVPRPLHCNSRQLPAEGAQEPRSGNRCAASSRSTPDHQFNPLRVRGRLRPRVHNPNPASHQPVGGIGGCYRVATSGASSSVCDAVNVLSISPMVRPLVSKPMNQIAAAATRYQKPK